MDRIPKKTTIVSFCISIIGVVLLYINTLLLGGQLSTTTMVSLCAYCIVLPIILTYFISRDYKLTKQERTLSAILSIIISQFITFGSYADAVIFISLVFESVATIGVWLLQSIIYSYIAYYFIKHIVFELQNFKFCQENGTVNCKRLFLVLFAVNVILIFVVYPCVFDYDAAVGMRTYLSPDDVKSNHHPYLIQMIHGFFWKLGKTIGNPATGFAILTFLFCGLSSAILTYGAYVVNKYGVGRKALKFTLILIPVYLAISHLPTKDGLFAFSFLAYSISIFELIFSRQQCLKSVRFLAIHCISIVLVCLSRNQGIYIVVFESLILFAYCYHNIFRLLITIAPAITIVLLFVKVFLPSQNVVSTGKAEMFGTLFQQTALYSINHQDDITPDEKDAINAILPIEEIQKAYTHDLTDPVKGCYCQFGKTGVLGTPRVYNDRMAHFSEKHIVNESSKLKNYISAWFTMFLRHPLTYFDAAFAVVYGYFYNKGESLFIAPWDLISVRATSPEYSLPQNIRVQKFVNDLFGYSAHIPLLNWFASIPYYLWLFFVIIFLVLFRKDWKGMVLLTPSILSLCLLLVCPVCVARYTYPILVCMPLYVFYTLLNNKQNNSYE